jgi:hypothetical protein
MAARKLSSPLSTVKEQDYSASPYMAERFCRGRGNKKDIMDIDNLKWAGA